MALRKSKTPVKRRARAKKAPTKRRTRAKKRYSWHGHAKAFQKLDAQACGEVLDALIEKHGQRLSAGVVIAVASDRSSPLHKAFPWDDKKAAQEYRLEVARRLLRSYCVTFVYEGGETREIRATISTANEDAPGKRVYSTVHYGLADPKLRAEWLQTALNEFEASQRKYSQLTELAPVFAAIDAAAKRYGRRTKRSRPSKAKPRRAKR